MLLFFQMHTKLTAFHKPWDEHKVTLTLQSIFKIHHKRWCHMLANDVPDPPILFRVFRFLMNFQDVEPVISLVLDEIDGIERWALCDLTNNFEVEKIIVLVPITRVDTLLLSKLALTILFHNLLFQDITKVHQSWLLLRNLGDLLFPIFLRRRERLQVHFILKPKWQLFLGGFVIRPAKHLEDQVFLVGTAKTVVVLVQDVDDKLRASFRHGDTGELFDADRAFVFVVAEECDFDIVNCQGCDD